MGEGRREEGRDGETVGYMISLPTIPTIRPITTLDSPFAPLGGSEKDEEKGVSGSG